MIDRLINGFLAMSLIGAAAFAVVCASAAYGAPFFFRFGWI
jgi:hypothetical protein